jgi:hypothetical protein
MLDTRPATCRTPGRHSLAVPRQNMTRASAVGVMVAKQSDRSADYKNQKQVELS